MRKPNFYYESTIWNKGYSLVAGVDEVGRGAFAGHVVAGCVVFAKQITKKLKITKTEKGKSKFLYDPLNSSKLLLNTLKYVSSKNNLIIQEFNCLRINDSKKLTPKQRDIADIWIRENALTWGIGEAAASEIDRLGIVKATRKAMRRAIGNANQRLHKRVQYLLIDAFYIPYVRGIRMPLKNVRISLRKGNKSIFRDRHSEQSDGSHNLIGQQTAIVKGDQKSFSIASASIIAKVYRDNLMISLGKRKKYKKYGWEKNKGYGTLKHRKVINKYGFVYLHRKSFTTNLPKITTNN